MKEPNYNNVIADVWKEAERLAPDCDDIVQRYGGLIKTARRSLKQNLTKSVLERALEFGLDVKFAFKEGMELVNDALLPGSTLTPAFATRSASHKAADANVVETPAAFAAVLKGCGCIGKLQVTTESSRTVKFTFALMDAAGRAIRPFYLTVKDENGTTLRERHCFNDWQGSVSDVQMATYSFLLEDEKGERSVELGVIDQ